MVMLRSRTTLAGALAALVLGAAACGDSTLDPAAGAGVTIQFAAVAPAAPAGAYSPATSHGGESLVIEGTNGTLELTGVHMIVSEFELDRVDANCDQAADEDECEEFEAPPSFVDLPLTGGAALAVSRPIPAGTYSELDFEIEDIEVDDDADSAKSVEIAQLISTIRAQFADWPEQAAVLVTGTFTPTGGAAVPFRVYLEAEIEIEMAFEPHLVITDDSPDKSVTVQLDPALWFKLGNGEVLDLSRYDFDTTGTVHEFEVEVENGFTKVEHEDDD